MKLRFTQRGRRHKISATHAVYLAEHYSPTPCESPQGNCALWWEGEDETGRKLEMMVLPTVLSGDPLRPKEGLIVHLMPTALRRN